MKERNKSFRLVFTIVAGIFIISIAFGLFYYFVVPKTAFINVSEVYDNFQYKLELEKELNSVQQTRTKMLDSLDFNLKQMYNEISQNKELNKKELEMIKYNFQIGRESYLQYKEKFDSENEDIKARYTSMIWKQLNQYIKEYGNIKGYSYIYGAKGDGSLMYAAENNNITKEITEFINKRYAGDEK